MFKPFYEFVTEIFGTITGNWLTDLFIVAAINEVLYHIVFQMVGRFKDETGVENGCILSLIHWTIRGILFVITTTVLSLAYKAFIFIQGLF